MGSRRRRRPASERQGESTTPTPAPRPPSRAEQRKAAAQQKPAPRQGRDISIFAPLETDPQLESGAARPWVLGSGAVAWLVAAGRAGYRRPLAYAAAILAVSALLAFHRPPWMAQRRTSGLAIGWHNLGVTLGDAGRADEAEALQLRAQIRATVGGASAAATPAATPAMLATASPTTGPAWTLSSEARAALVASLSARRAGMPVWIVYDSRYASAEAFARQLVTIFEEAHWSAKPLARASFAMRPGLFIFAADDPPSDSSSAAGESLIAANLKPTIGTGYRAYAEEQRANNPNWRGISFEPEQSFVIAVGRPPEP